MFKNTLDPRTHWPVARILASQLLTIAEDCPDQKVS